MRASFCICTYNRAESLRRTLGSVASISDELKGKSHEVIVVDNNSSDATRAVCDQYANDLVIRYVRERKQGLSHARNRALEEFKGDLLVYTDDDVVIARGWLTTYWRAKSEYPRVDFFGGRVVPQWNIPKPRWLVDERLHLLEGLLVNYDLGHENRWLTNDDPFPFGASFGITRRLIESVGEFRTDLGVKGESPGRGEEADYLERARRKGFHGVYLGEAACGHVVDPKRLRLGYIYRYGIEKGVAERRMRNAATEASLKRELGFAVRGLGQLLKGRGDRFRQCVINMGIQKGMRKEKFNKLNR